MDINGHQFEVTKHPEIDYIKWEEIEANMNPIEYNDFCKFMNGQTCFEDGVYVCDVINFFRPKSKRFFD